MDKYGIDAFHLDVSHYIVNDANGLVEGLTSAEANILMHNELVEAMPGTVFSGELIHEVSFFRESFAQRAGWAERTHPISAFLFSPYTRFYGHLGIPGADPPHSLLDLLKSYESQGVLPTARIGDQHVLNEPLTQEILAIAREWQALGLTPDLECDWGASTLFQYTTHTGDIVTYQNADGVSSFHIPGGHGYQRVHGVSQVRTDWSLPDWYAYNDTTILGLNPNIYYFLDNAPRDTSQLHINALSPDVYVAETRVTPQAAFFRFESTSGVRDTTVDMYLPMPPLASVPKTLVAVAGNHYRIDANLSRPVVIILAAPHIRLPYNLRDNPFIAGVQQSGIFRVGSHHGSGKRTEATLDGIRKETISAHPPKFHAEAILQFAFTLPDAPSTLSYSMGLAGEHSEGVLFEIRLNGQTHVNFLKDTFDWTDGSISLDEFAGEPVLLEFVTDPGQYDGNGADYDWAHWGDLIITEEKHSADVNNDGLVNILDLTLVAQAFGTDSKEGDVNGDGVVNVFDLVFVANAF